MSDDPISSPAALSSALAGVGYLADVPLATAGYLALRLGRPLFLEGDAGVARRRSRRPWPVPPARTSSGYSATRGWTPPRRSTTGTSPADPAPARRRGRGGQRAATGQTRAELEASLYDRRFLIAPAAAAGPGAQPVGDAGRRDRPGRRRVRGVPARGALRRRDHHPELGRIAADSQRPLTVLTSNRTRDVHDALKRRCLYHWVEHPSFEREVAILRAGCRR